MGLAYYRAPAGAPVFSPRQFKERRWIGLPYSWMRATSSRKDQWLLPAESSRGECSANHLGSSPACEGTSRVYQQRRRTERRRFAHHHGHDYPGAQSGDERGGVWGPEDLEPFLSCKPESDTKGSFVEMAGKMSESSLGAVASAFAQDIPSADLQALVDGMRQSGQIPREIDGQLLARGGSLTKAQLDTRQKKEIRAAFPNACERRLEQ